MSSHLTTTFEQDRKRVALQATRLRIRALLELALPPTLALTPDAREALINTERYLISEILLFNPSPVTTRLSSPKSPAP